jgi:hypothetical protein
MNKQYYINIKPIEINNKEIKKIIKDLELYE